MSLDLKEAETTKGGKRPVPWGLQANLILPIPPKKSAYRGNTVTAKEGELESWETDGEVPITTYST